MHRLIPLMALISAGCGKGGDLPPATGSPTPTPEPTGLTSSGTPGGTNGGTPGGTPTGTTTTNPPTDFCPPWPAATGTTVVAAPADAATLQTTLDGLNPGDTLVLQSGTYALTAPLALTVPGVTVRSETGNRADVVLDGTQTATSIFQVLADDVSLVSLTLKNAFDNGVTVVPSGVDLGGLALYDLDIVDNSQYGVFIDGDSNTWFADGGTIACSHIGLTATGRATVRNACRTAGIEGLRAEDWLVTDTQVDGYWCSSGLAAAGIRFWRGSRGTTIQRSRLVDNRRGVVLGQGIDALARSYPDTPCGGIVAQHFQGAVHNTVVWAKDSGLAASAGGIVDGIAVENSCEVEILHNTVHLGASPTDGSIIHRYANTSGIVANNLTHNTIRRQDGAVTVSNHNIENMPDNTWVSIGTGDFHLAPATVDPIDAGDPQWLTSVPQDVDGHDRAPTPDAGIDER